jgi:hypothetical protein
MEPTHAHSISHSELREIVDRGTGLGDDSNTFMSEPLIGVTVVLIGSANAAVGYLDDDLGWSWVTVAFGFNDVSGFGAFEDCEINAHDWGGNRINLGMWEFSEKCIVDVY